MARELSNRGWKVVVCTSARGYDDPTVRYLRRELTAEAVEIRRFALASFGKATIPRRVLAATLFMLQSLIAGLRTPSLRGVLVSTSPPLIGVVAIAIKFARSVPFGYWAMDLNPDQLVALGKITEHGWISKALHAVNKWILRRANFIVALDAFMKERIEKREAHLPKVIVIPPWAPGDDLGSVPRRENEFRARLGVGDAILFMYSGNHTPSNPLSTLLSAAIALRSENWARFVFVGGGASKTDVEKAITEHKLTNVLSLPYQPKAQLSVSLGAADVHVVTLGERMAGIVHPCKVYGAMAVARPILYFGPTPSHVSELIRKHGIGWVVAHGDTVGAVETIRKIAALRASERDEIGARARSVVMQDFGNAQLCSRFCDVSELYFAQTS